MALHVPVADAARGPRDRRIADGCERLKSKDAHDELLLLLLFTLEKHSYYIPVPAI